jgi:hypothetical protein
MAFGVHFRRSVHSVTKQFRRGAATALRGVGAVAHGVIEGAKTIDRVHSRVRPAYEIVKPLLGQHINVPMTDRYLGAYDAIRRSVITANNLHRQLQQ